VSLEINSLGSNEARSAYKEQLVAYLQSRQSELDEDSLRRLDSNPLRVLDSKNPQVQAVVKDAPKLIDCLDAQSQQHFQALCERLDKLGIQYRVNSALVRGLDYYNRTVFEWVTESLGAQGTVCAGGRYDGLVEQLGGKATQGVGFAIGLERLVLLLQTLAPDTYVAPAVDIYVTAVDDEAQDAIWQVAEQLREQLPWVRTQTHCGGGNVKKQMKKADASGAKLAFLLGQSELQGQYVTVKFLREQQEQITVANQDLVTFVQTQLPGN